MPASAQCEPAAGDVAEHHLRRVRRSAQPFAGGSGLRRLALVARFFTLQQAEQVLPQVESVIREAIALKSEYQQAESECQEFRRRVMLQGGMLVDHSKLLDRNGRRDASAQQLKEAIQKILEYG